jgi:hypothetical protein
MSALAGKREVTEEALEALYKNALPLIERPELGSVSEVFSKIGENPNVSVSMLIRMVESDQPAVRLGASQNPKLPKAVKLAYLRRAWSSRSEAERRRVAEDPDTPVEILERLASDPVATWPLARNPSTPVSLLEKLAASNDPSLRKEALANLSKRR